MKALEYVALFLLGIAVTSSLFGEGLLKNSNEWTPFLERIDPKEFLIVEHKLSESHSDTSELVIYDAYFYPKACSFALTRKLGLGYILKITMPNPDGPIETTIRLPSDIAERLLSVMELALTYHVYAPTGKALENADDSYAWINLRIDSTRTLSGMVRLGSRDNRCLVGQGLDSSWSFRELLYQMRQLSPTAPKYYFGGKNPFGYSQLFVVDLAILDLRLSYPAQD